MSAHAQRQAATCSIAPAGISFLRRHNEVLNARLEVFDSMMAVFHEGRSTQHPGGCSSPDIGRRWRRQRRICVLMPNGKSARLRT
jgi:hypothetical protein